MSLCLAYLDGPVLSLNELVKLVIVKEADILAPPFHLSCGAKGKDFSPSGKGLDEIGQISSILLLDCNRHEVPIRRVVVLLLSLMY